MFKPFTATLPLPNKLLAITGPAYSGKNRAATRLVLALRNNFPKPRDIKLVRLADRLKDAARSLGIEQPEGPQGARKAVIRGFTPEEIKGFLRERLDPMTGLAVAPNVLSHDPSPMPLEHPLKYKNKSNGTTYPALLEMIAEFLPNTPLEYVGKTLCPEPPVIILVGPRGKDLKTLEGRQVVWLHTTSKKMKPGDPEPRLGSFGIKGTAKDPNISLLMRDRAFLKTLFC